MFLEYVKVKFTIKNPILALTFNKNFIVFGQCGICRPTLLILALSDIAFLKNIE